MTQLVGIADNLICSSQSNDEKTTTVTGIQVRGVKKSSLDRLTHIVLSRILLLNQPGSKLWSNATGLTARRRPDHFAKDLCSWSWGCSSLYCLTLQVSLGMLLQICTSLFVVIRS